MSKIIVFLYKLFYFLHKLGIPLLPHILNTIVVRLGFGCYIGMGAKLGKNVKLGYGGLGIVIHSETIIGAGSVIGTGVTIGGVNRSHGVPVVGCNCMISTGAKILGPIKIGSNCVVGANAVVLRDIPANSVAVGIPARVIKKNINIQDYR